RRGRGRSSRSGRPSSRGANAPALRFTFLTSTPQSPIEGSGTFVGLHGLVRGLERLGHVARVRPLRTRTHFHTLDRWLYNAGGFLWPPAGDVVVGVDLDGFLWARRRRSEERRVGKECRSRGWAYHEKEKEVVGEAGRSVVWM